MTNKIVEALLKLDTQNDDHWTADGLPRLDTIKMLTSDQTVTRHSIATAAPGFSRTTATGYTPPNIEQPASQQQSQKSSARQQSATSATQTTTQAIGSDQQADNFDTEQLSMEDRAEVATDRPSALEEALIEQEKLVASIRAQKVEIDKAFEEARAKEDKLRDRLEKANPQRSVGNDIQDYLTAQRKNLEVRAARQKMIRESGINLKELVSSLKAPIDAARERRTTRGS